MLQESFSTLFLSAFNQPTEKYQIAIRQVSGTTTLTARTWYTSTFRGIFCFVTATKGANDFRFSGETSPLHPTPPYFLSDM
jgi:hypothetical protein